MDGADDSSSEDEDYQPTAKEVRADEEEQTRSKRHKSHHKAEAASTSGASAGEQQQERGSREPQAHSKEATKKAKVAALWQQLNNRPSSTKALQPEGEGKSQPPKPASTLSLAALCRPVKKSAGASDKEWMRQLGIAPRAARAGSTIATARQGPSDEGTLSQPPPSGLPAKPLDVSVAAAALAAAKAAVSSANSQNYGKVSVTETRRFAGKDVQVSKMADAAEVEAGKAKRKQAGLDAVLASLQRAKKVNVLDKSRNDWTTFKSADAQVEEELEAYKKSGGKYLDKVDFLKRAELREYELERDKRLAGDVRSRGR